MPVVHNLINTQTLAEIFAALDHTQPLALALSGGGDSMGLLHLLLQWRGPNNLYALTVDHGLREGSAAEAAQVKLWCQELSVHHQTLTWNHEPVTTGLQAKARKARYDLMSTWCLANNIKTLLTAHTIEDQAETVAMRKLRTTSPKSLAAIWPESNWNGVTLLRPLLETSSKNLREYLQSIGQTWLEDPSNKNEKFERVRLRQQQPELHLAIEAQVAQTKFTTIKAQAKAWLNDHFTITHFGMGQLQHQDISQISEDMRDEILTQIITNLGGTLPEREKRHNLAQWLIKASSSRCTCAHLIFARRKFEIIIGREPARMSTTTTGLSQVETFWDRRFLITGPAGSQVSTKMHFTHLPRNPKIPSFIDQALPIIQKDGNILADCFSNHHQDVKIRFITK